MRLTTLLAALAVMLAFGPVATEPAYADSSWRKSHAPRGWGRTRTIKHHIYYPRYRHVYKVHPRTDPYAYHYDSRHKHHSKHGRHDHGHH